MAKETIIVLWCDGEHPERTEGTGTVTIGIDGHIRQLDLCDPCKKQLVTPLAELLHAQGQPVPGQGGQRRKAPLPDGPCPECGKTFPTVQGLATHRSRVHGVRGVNYQEGRKR